jgi:hypothetical protein
MCLVVNLRVIFLCQHCSVHSSYIRLEAHLPVIFFMSTLIDSWLANICLVAPLNERVLSLSNLN